MNALIFIVKPKIRAGTSVSANEFGHFIFVQIHIASVCVGILVIFVKFAIFTVCFLLISVFRKIHALPHVKLI